MKIHTIEVQETPEGEAFIEFPDEVLKEVGWKEGDTIKWTDNNDGSFTLKKAEKTEWVLVETVSQFRMRYMVEVPKGKKEWALDTVVCEEAKEFSQEHLGETIVSHRVVSEDEALTIYDQDNDYLKSWNKETKIKNAFTTMKDIEAKRNSPDEE
jgi:bifunctional DNA-binding transcriptional regulator/antitoxin component of YhaV-PrlF toxin-antitoxin module